MDGNHRHRHGHHQRRDIPGRPAQPALRTIRHRCGIDWMRQQLTTAAPAHNQQQRNTLQERRTTKMDFTWFKSAGLAAVQNFATPSWCVRGNAVDVLHVNWVDTLSIGAARRSSQC
ncbi:hypothetical protein I552_10241 [Mycobacterium xenopi 3993]|nr:hypothetical protein I552_10241 [Mycobacterium xenopi 3993]